MSLVKRSIVEHTEAGHKLLTLKVNDTVCSVTRNPHFPDSAGLFVLFLPNGEWMSEAVVYTGATDDIESVGMQLPIGWDQAVFIASNLLSGEEDIYEEVDDFVTVAFRNTF
jgi:hypothetical protein